MKITEKYYFFFGTIYSQWFGRTSGYLFKDTIDGKILKFKTAEHYMMYQKATLFKDFELAEKILNTKTPKSVKKLGRLVKNFNQEIWDSEKFNIVVNGNLLKFTQNIDLFEDLMKNKDKIFVEASPYDKIWGIGLSCGDERCLDETKWQGQNLLGKAINKVIELINENKYRF